MSTKQATGSSTVHKTSAGKDTSTKGISAKGNKQSDSRLEEFFHDELKDIYLAENQWVKTHPKMAIAATSEELKGAFTEHLTVTKEHVARLEKVFEILGHKA